MLSLSTILGAWKQHTVEEDESARRQGGKERGHLGALAGARRPGEDHDVAPLLWWVRIGIFIGVSLVKRAGTPHIR